MSKDVILRFRELWYALKRLLICNLQFHLHPQDAVFDCHRGPPLSDLPMTVMLEPSARDYKGLNL